MVKQLLTLATGSIGGIVALFDNEDLPGVQLSGSPWLVEAIAFLAVSMIAGLLTLGAITSQLTKKEELRSANAPDVRWPAMAQMLAFALGLVAVAAEVVQVHWGWGLVLYAALLAYAGALRVGARKKKARQKEREARERAA